MDRLIICKRCVYCSEIKNISFDSEGICNYCRMAERMEKEYPNGREGNEILTKIIQKIKKAGRNRKYDCVVGVSGGTDSSYLLYKMVSFGLRPLAVHFDNTWNSRIATENIYKMTNKLDVDLYTHVVNNREFDDIIKSFLFAGVPELNIATDIALAVTLYQAAEKYKIKYQIEGHSFRTEGVSPLGWAYMDAKYIESVQKRYGKYEIKTLPNLWMKDFLRWIIFFRIKKIRPLYYIDYNKKEAQELLKNDFGWEDYGGHHLENKLSMFCHTYYFPRRIGIDQRKNGFSALVRSGQMKRDEAIEILSTPPEYDPELITYLKKRFNLSDKEFDDVLDAPLKSYRDFKTYKKTFERMRPFFWLMYKLDLVPKSFYVKYTARNEI